MRKTKKSQIWPDQVRKVRTGKVAPYTAMFISIMLIVVGLVIVIDSPPTGQIENNKVPPQVNSSSTQYEITWTVWDEYAPNPRYRVTVNGLLKPGHDDEPWVSGVPIVVNVSGHFPGVYNYTIVVNDGHGSTAEDTVTVTVDNPMILDSPPDVFFDYEIPDYGDLVFHLNETLDLTTPTPRVYDLNVFDGVLEFIFRPIGDIFMKTLFHSYDNLKVTNGYEIGYGGSLGFSITSNQTYRLTIWFNWNGASDCQMYLALDNELGTLYPKTFCGDYQFYFDNTYPLQIGVEGVGYPACPMIVYEFNIWQVS